MKTISHTEVMASIYQLVPQSLKDHSYGMYELARECAKQLHAPICEIMPSFSDSLHKMVNHGDVQYDRQHNRVFLG